MATTSPPAGLLRRVARRSRPGKPVFHFPMAASDIVSLDWIEDLIDASKTATVAADDYTQASVTRIAEICKSVNASVAIKTSPYSHSPWLTSHDPRDADSGGHVAFEESRLRTMKAIFDSYHCPVIAIIADSEVFNYKNPGEANEVAWNAALVTRYNTMYDMYKSVFPDAHVHWYSRGWIRWINSTPSAARILPKYVHFTLVEKGDDVSPVVYRPEWYNQERFCMDLTAELGRSIGQTTVCPWISLGFGSHYDPTFKSENWLYPVEAAYRWGRYMLRGNDRIKMVFTYPAPGKSPYYWSHFEPFMIAGREVRRFWQFTGNTNHEV